jgi:hypothetical protein
MFYSEKYLKEFELDNLEMIPGNDYLLMGKRGNSRFYNKLNNKTSPKSKENEMIMYNLKSNQIN